MPDIIPDYRYTDIIPNIIPDFVPDIGPDVIQDGLVPPLEKEAAGIISSSEAIVLYIDDTFLKKRIPIRPVYRKCVYIYIYIIPDIMPDVIADIIPDIFFVSHIFCLSSRLSQ
jgi:hypothetical protein